MDARNCQTSTVAPAEPGVFPFVITDWEDSAREIREYFIPDFSNWEDHNAYKLAFDRLLKDLQGAPPARQP